jgi:hypothetical protein
MTQELSKEPLNEIVPADLDTMTATKETLRITRCVLHRAVTGSGRPGSSAFPRWGIACLAGFAIGANVGISYGTNALWGILIFAVVIFLTGFPVALNSARYNIDLDLVTRGSGFGYYGSVDSKVIFATFTFALERTREALPLWGGLCAGTISGGNPAAGFRRATRRDVRASPAAPRGPGGP